MVCMSNRNVMRLLLDNQTVLAKIFQQYSVSVIRTALLSRLSSSPLCGFGLGFADQQRDVLVSGFADGVRLRHHSGCVQPQAIPRVVEVGEPF
jgi:hypothetical protein